MINGTIWPIFYESTLFTSLQESALQNHHMLSVIESHFLLICDLLSWPLTHFLDLWPVDLCSSDLCSLPWARTSGGGGAWGADGPSACTEGRDQAAGGADKRLAASLQWSLRRSCSQQVCSHSDEVSSSWHKLEVEHGLWRQRGCCILFCSTILFGHEKFMLDCSCKQKIFSVTFFISSSFFVDGKRSVVACSALLYRNWS